MTEQAAYEHNGHPVSREAFYAIACDPARSVAVEACAGAGKTWMLVSRMLRALLDGAAPHEILAITFTKKAAGEMRQRLQEWLEAFAQAPLGDLTRELVARGISPERALDKREALQNLYRQMLSSGRPVQIRTFHSWFAALLGTAPLALLQAQGLPANFELLEDDAEAVREVWGPFLQTVATSASLRADYEAVVARHGRSQTHKALAAALAKRVEFDLADVAGVVDASVPPFQVQYPDLAAFNEPSEALQDEACHQRGLGRAKALGPEANKTPQKAADAIIDALACGDLNQRLDMLRKAMFVAKEDRLSKNLEKFPAAQEAEPELQRLLTARRQHDAWQHQQRMARLARCLIAEFAAVKHQHGWVDMNDVERTALVMLADPILSGWVQERLDARIRHLLVDEFQDTNFIQNAIVELLSNGTNVFRVGDVKQSIYRFRNAQPELMQGMKGVEDTTHEVLYLTHNYRSTPTLVSFNNELFDRLMNFTELDSSYTQQDRVFAGKQPEPTDAKVEFHFLEKDDKAPIIEESTSEDEAAVSDAELQSEDVVEEIKKPFDPYAEAEVEAHPKAVHIANTILKMRTETEFKNFKDYVVLVRSNAIKAQIKTVFEEANIPHHISVKSGFFNSDAVQDVLMIMNFLVNPTDNINLTGLLLSDFIQMTNEELAQLKLSTPKYGSFWDTLKSVKPEVYAKLSQFTADLSDANLVDTLRAIYRFNGYYESSCTLQQRANLDYLIEKAQHYAKQNTSRIEFVWLVKTIEDEESSEAIPFTEEDDVVRVMTIHQSKGLEFKVVFFWSQGKTTIKDNQEALLIDSQLGFSLKSLSYPYRYTRKNPIRLAMEMKTVRDDVQEQVRLLYVALTRAEKRLIIVDNKPSHGVANLHYTSILNSMGPTNWMMSAFPDGHPTFERKSFLIDGTINKADIEVVAEQTLTVTPKPQQAIVFKAPSATHKSFAHFKLNFDPSVGTNHGTMMHELFEHLPSQGVTREMIVGLLPDIDEADIQAVLAFYADPVIRCVENAQWIHEFPFYALINQEVWHGYMDLVVISDTDITLIDYKTDRVEDPQVLVELYQEQLQAYMRVLRQMHPTKAVKAYLYSLKFSKFIPINDPQ